MFNPIPKGNLERIYQYDCQLPPEGHGKNAASNELEYIGVISSSTKKKEQKWQRIPLPKDWEKRCRKEEERQAQDPAYFDHDLEKFRQQMWRYRLCGCWFLRNGKATYITGNHFYYLNFIQIDIGFPSYRNNDRKFFYVWAYCEEDPRCGGLLQAARRREGKTFKGGSILLEYISRTNNATATIQSKTASDSKGVFLKAVVNPFKKLPSFWRPVFDTSKGVTPTSELKFSHTTVKGKRALDNLGKPSLDSYIDWKSSDIFAIDGSKQNRHFEDEVGKTMEVDVYERWQVNRFCSDQDGVWIGKNLLSTTVEEMENGGEAFQKLWDASDPNVRDKNGRTKSGLYRYFLPAQETTFFDEYGDPEIERAVEYYINQRDGLRDDQRALSSIIRKNPMQEADMFRIDGDNCLFDSMKLNNRRDELSWMKVTERGNLEWVEKDKEVKWVKHANGRWEICKGFQFEEGYSANNVVFRGSQPRPGNVSRITSGTDPYDHDTTQDDGRRSNGASYVKLKHFPGREDHPFNNAFFLRYNSRPDTAAILYEDMIKQCFWCGCEMLIESNKPGMIKFFKERGYIHFLVILPGYKDYGIPSTPQNKQVLAEVTEEYVSNYIEKVYFIKLIESWLKFNLKDTQKEDDAMAAGWCEVSDKYKLVPKRTGDLKDITTLFKQHSYA
jgi:hypothetical protein